jgi:2,3,4,5-tetrahydropyridine-2-carboxylate N-succinyltransferase
LNRHELQLAVERLAAADDCSPREARPVVRALLEALEAGRVRAAEPDVEGAGWRVNPWVKQGILLGFRLAENREQHLAQVFHFRDRESFATLDVRAMHGDVRVVPGGTSVRSGAYLGRGVVIMPPAYVNVGAWVGDGSMIDSHALVGSCAQVGSGVHLSAAVQVGGVLEPVGACPVIVEDGAFLGGGCGIYEGVQIGSEAVLAPGVILTGAVPLHDLVHGRLHRAMPGQSLRVPPRAVVVPGSRPAQGAYAQGQGLQLQAPMIVKYRDPETDAALTLEQALR